MKIGHKYFFILIAAAFFCAAVFFARQIQADEVDVDVSTSTKTIVLKDSDGDGLLDAEDPHPDIPEIFIVQDEDRNGIVDSFEKPVDEVQVEEKLIIQSDEETSNEEE